MTKEQRISSMKAGDFVVDGLFSGLLAGVVMAAYLLVAGLLAGDNPVDLLAGFSPGSDAAPLTGALMHLAVSGIYGGVFGGSWLVSRFWWNAIPGWQAGLLGLAYGFVLWLLAQSVVLPATGSIFAGLPGIQTLVAHVLYGVVLGILFMRNVNRIE